MSWRRAKSPGWAAFDLKQRLKDCFDDEGDQEPYPPMSSAMTSCGPSHNAVQKNDLPVRSFSSVLLPAMQFPALPVDENHRRPSASTSSRQDGFNYSVGESSYDYMLRRNNDSDNAGTNLNLGHLKTIPIEPEWEENDIYLFHRKEAIKMMRSASQHSRAATDAYTRGDHFTAQQFSAKAREEWTAAERLNFKAAKEILSIRNNENGAWKLDLHGLHAAEAVQALQERLQKLESLVPSDRSISPKRNSKRAGIVRCASLESLSCTQKLYEEHASSLQRPTTLHVITGIGNHSRGQAALPTAIRNFLNENSYHYDEPRPGLITMRPKFRRQ